MKSKKTLLSIFTCIMMIFLAACSGGGNGGSDGASTTAGEKDGDSGSTAAVAQGVTDSEIKVGWFGPQTGNVAIYDLVRKGIDSYFKYVNENGGVDGRELKLIAYDDQYQPAKGVQLSKRLVEEDKVFAIIGAQGSPSNSAAKDFLMQSGVPVLLPGTGLKEFVEPPIKNWMGTAMMQYGVEASILLDYAVNDLGAKKIALAYQNDDLGQEMYNSIKKNIENYPEVEIVEEVSFLSTDTEFSSQAQKIDKAKPDTVFNFGTTNPAVNLKKALYKIGFDQANYVVSSAAALDSAVFDLAGKDVWEGTYSGDRLKNLSNAPNDEGLQLFVDRFSKDFPNESVSSIAQTGWGVAQVFVEAVKRTEGDLTWDHFLEAFHTFDKWDGSMFAGITFSPDNHYGVTSMYLTQAKDGQILPITEPISFDPATGEINYSE